MISNLSLKKLDFIKFFNSFTWWQLAGIILLFCFAMYFRVDGLYHLGFVFDTVTTQYSWGQAALDLGFGPFWVLYRGFFDYLPGALFFLMSLAAFSKVLDPIIPGGGDYSFVFILKFFNSVADLVFVILIYLLATRKAKLNRGNALLFSAFVFALPSLWFVSSVWGQFDTFVVLFGIGSIILFYKSLSQPKAAFWRSYAFWSGILFGLGFWIKIQIIILLPVLLLLYFGGRSPEFIKKIIIKVVLWLLAFAMVISIGVLLYFFSDNYYHATIIILGAFFGYILYKSYRSIQKESIEGREVFLQGFGFWVSSWFIAIIPIIYNPALVFFNIGGPFTKSDSITNGASTFWPLVGMTGFGSDKLVDIYGFGPSVSLVGNLVYAISMVLLYFKFSGFRLSYVKELKYKLNPILERLFNKKLEFTDLIIFMSVNCGFYFMFMTKMHSRYLIWCILFSLLATVLLIGKKRWKLWLLATLLIHFGYFLNQLGVYNAWAEIPIWTDYLAGVFKFDVGAVSSLSNLIGVLSLYSLAWLRFEDNNKSTATG